MITKINYNVIKVINILKNNGFEAYLVGGAVRDLLLNHKINDYDITTNAYPEIIKKLFNDYKIYEVKSSTEVKDIYINDAAYQYYVLTNLGYDVSSVSIVYINSNYVRYGKLNIDELFSIEDITDIAISKQEEIRNNIIEINNYMEHKEEEDKDIGIHCFEPYSCPFFKYCTKWLPDRNVFGIRRMKTQTKLKLYQKNIYGYEDLLKEDINDKYKQQIEYELYDKEPYINKDGIKLFLDNLSYPLYFLDFETYQQSIPLYDGISPYMQIPFQYSLHYIESDGGELKHREFLAEPGIDPRRELAERLVIDIPRDSCVLAYNMMFEKMVIKNLASLYEDLAEHLMNIYDNMQDLMIIFQKRDYYIKEMYGSYSIKYVLPAVFPNDKELDYHNLDLIHNGGEASNSYAKMGDMSIEERTKIRESLLRYCELDTYAMVKIWYKLREIIK